jgi:hypothetical protein
LTLEKRGEPGHRSIAIHMEQDIETMSLVIPNETGTQKFKNKYINFDLKYVVRNSKGKLNHLYLKFAFSKQSFK